MVELGLKITLAYCLGSVLGSVLVGRMWGGQDVRAAGSGNPGATNALRTRGKGFAVCVLLIDVGKGILALAVIPGLPIPGVGADPAVDRSLLLYAVGLAALLGHVFPIWFDLKGGKGGATAAGLLAYLAPVVLAPVIGVWLLVIFVTGFVGIATVTAAWVAAAWVGWTGLPEQHGFFVFTCLVASLILYTHRTNLRRMLRGEEARFDRFFGLVKKS